jgi:hypothetical protein
MRNTYGLRAVIVVPLLALGCRMGRGQIGPRYVIELTDADADPCAADVRDACNWRARDWR